MHFIKDLHEGERFSQIYFCKQKQSGTTKAGRTYYSLVLQDKTGTIDGKIWELNPGIDHFEALDFIQVETEVTSFAGALQLNIKRVRRAREGEYAQADFFPTSIYDPKVMYQELMQFEGSIQNEKLKALLDSFFVEDAKFIQAFQMHSAAKSVHHGFIGGLLQHTLAVTKLCDFYCQQYALLNRDLLLTAAMCHDIGKLQELSDFPANDYTDDGQLLGHIVMGVELLGARIREIPGFPAKLATELKHCILAHHGEYEYGSPKKPAIIEALALNFADNTDAKIQIMTELIDGSDSTDWLGFNRLMDSNVRRTSL